MTKGIKIKRAHIHNLKDIDLSIPHNRITVVTGVSGSGKSSLIYHTIFREAQNRFLSTLSGRAREIAGKMDQSDVEYLTGLRAAVALDQGGTITNPRSTVGTVSGTYDLLRLLFAREGLSDRNIEINRSLFSFNSPKGACPLCSGLGVKEVIDPSLLVKDPSKTLREGALVITKPDGYTIYSQVTIDVMDRVCNAHGFNVDTPWNELSESDIHMILNGSDRLKIPYGKHSLESRMKWKGIKAKPREEGFYKGILPVMEDILRRDRNQNILRFVKSVVCPECGGSRLSGDARSVRFKGLRIDELADMTIAELLGFFKDLNNLSPVASSIRDELFSILEPAVKTGVSYLPLSRSSATLSGGELRRLKLVNQIRTDIRGVLYILDEPSTGLHYRDREVLGNLIKSLRSNGNTVLMTAHDREMMKLAGNIIDIGPGPGRFGGEVIYSGELSDFLESERADSSTNRFLRQMRTLPTVSNYDREEFTLPELSKNNLKRITPTILRNSLNLITGVSGAGKSSMVSEILSLELPFRRTVSIDKSPIGKNSRSNPATYTKLFDRIRELFASLPDSKKRGFDKGTFSFNVKGGRCTKCEGAGVIDTGMHFMGKLQIKCDACGGKRFRDDVLECRYRNKSIHDVLEMEIGEAIGFFEGEKMITDPLKVMNELGLGYIKLGQPSGTLSGGEAQRIKIAAELGGKDAKNVLFTLDEPSSGLHPEDITLLLRSFSRLREEGGTILVIEHNPFIVEQADRVIDLGPESGIDGGEILYEGAPAGLLKEKSHTGRMMKVHFDGEIENDSEKFKDQSLRPIEIKGARTNNLKNVDLEIPTGKLTVVTGPSGSGKSSLVFDTLYEECRSLFSTTFSSYARRYMDHGEKADIDKASGLMPAVAIRGEATNFSPRSTVGTVSGIYDLYRLLYSRLDGNSLSSAYSFNHEMGACPHCSGMGKVKKTSREKVIRDFSKSIFGGALSGHKVTDFYGDPHGRHMAVLKAVELEMGLDFSKPVEKLSENEREILFSGAGDKKFNVEWHYKRGNRSGIQNFEEGWMGLLHYVDEEYCIKHATLRGPSIEELLEEIECGFCNGSRLRKESLKTLFLGMNIKELADLSVENTLNLFNNLPPSISSAERAVFNHLSAEILEKLQRIKEAGLGYLSVSRPVSTLSGGELTRLTIASRLGGELTDILYILDEPTRGLHDRDTKKLITMLKKLREKGNTVVVVEHDAEVIRSADHIIDMGPGAGEKGGKIVATGTLEEIRESGTSTAKLLEMGPLDWSEKSELTEGICVKNATLNNLKIEELKIPTGGMVAFAGLSGSGKSSLVVETVLQSVRKGKPVGADLVTGHEKFENVVASFDTSRVKTPYSNIMTITGIFEKVRNLFAKEGKEFGIGKSHFQTAKKGGRCETCKGLGTVKISMDFLSDIREICPDCRGERFTEETLTVKYQKRNIAEIYKMTVSEALRFFKDRKIETVLRLLEEIGLGHIPLGRGADTFSAGETTRLRLAVDLLNPSEGKTLYILDEPTTGLHTSDIETLIALLEKLKKRGHTIYIIEHNLQVITRSDWVIELGPEAGDQGGKIVFEGTPEQLKERTTPTAQALINH